MRRGEPHSYSNVTLVEALICFLPLQLTKLGSLLFPLFRFYEQITFVTLSAVCFIYCSGFSAFFFFRLLFNAAI